MKLPLIIAAACLPAITARAEDGKSPAEMLAIHRDGSTKLADEQDELSADVQQLVVEQTNPKVIELLAKVEDIMDEATDRLAEPDTGGETIAAQTEIIELIHAAAKEKQSQGSGKSGSAMMDMMERMMGEKPDGEPKPGNKPGDQGGGGVTGDSDSANDTISGEGGGTGEIRRVPKATGSANAEIPAEFRKAFDAYNRGAEQKVK